MRFDPLPADVRTDELRARLEAVPLLAGSRRVLLRKAPDSPLVLVVTGGPAASETEAERVSRGLETLLSGLDEARITMESGRVVTALLVRSRSGLSVLQTILVLGKPPAPQGSTLRGI